MIEVADLLLRSSSRPRVEVGPVSFSLAPGASYALVGTAADGVDLLLEALAGEVAPRRGSVKIAEGPPGPGRALAYVAHVPCLPEVFRVDAYLRLASRLRGEPPALPEDRLAVLGVAPLARRRIGGLSQEEARAVALVEALTSQASVLLLAEPLVDLDPRAVGRVAAALQARVEAGATAVVSTASLEDASALGHDLLYFDRGKLARRTSDKEAWAPPMGPRGARLFIRSEGARFLLAELAGNPTFDQVHGEGADLVVTGKDPVAMAAAVAAATRQANVELDLLRFEQPERDA
jgi:ABC-type multidrug transport system ATPase subunit